MKLKKYLGFVGLFVVLVSVAILGFECPPQAIVVEIGWHLFTTQSATLMVDNNAIEFEGVPLGRFDFGEAIGERDIGPIDTIIERLEIAEVADVGEAVTIPVEVVALQLKSKEAIDPDGPDALESDFLYATLSETQSSLGTMTIMFTNDDGGTLNSEFTVHFVIRIGSLNGPITDEVSITFKATDVTWGRRPSAAAFEIEGVNTFLNGNNRNTDFWFIGGVIFDDDGGSTQSIHDQGGGN